MTDMTKKTTSRAKKTTAIEDSGTGLKGSLDVSYQTQQRDMFSSGIVSEIGVNSFAVWHAIKSHADFETGQSYPGIRRLIELTGLSNASVQKAIKTLEAAHLLRVTRLGQKNIYMARERMNVRIGSRVVCTVVIDYIPGSMKARLAKLKEATLSGDMGSEDVWANVDVLPGEGFVFDKQAGMFRGRMRADEVPAEALGSSDAAADVALARQKLRALANETRKGLLKK